MRKYLMVIALFGLVAGACGGDDDDGGAAADSPLAQAIADEVEAEAESGDSPVSTREEAECFAGRIVSGIGEERLNELGVTEDNVGDIEDVDFTDEEISTVVSAMTGCVDIKAALAEQFEPEFGAEGAECLADNLDDDLIETMVASGLSDDGGEMPDEFFQAFLDIAAECDLDLN